jgi:hypothetical protein
MQATSELTQYRAIAVLAVVFLERSFSFALRLLGRKSGDKDEAILKVADDIRNDVRATRKGVWALVQRGRMSGRCEDGSEFK